jgi:hypothetical protein
LDARRYEALNDDQCRRDNKGGENPRPAQGEPLPPPLSLPQRSLSGRSRLLHPVLLRRSRSLVLQRPRVAALSWRSWQKRNAIWGYETCSDAVFDDGSHAVTVEPELFSGSRLGFEFVTETPFEESDDERDAASESGLRRRRRGRPANRAWTQPS